MSGMRLAHVRSLTTTLVAAGVLITVTALYPTLVAHAGSCSGPWIPSFNNSNPPVYSNCTLGNRKGYSFRNPTISPTTMTVFVCNPDGGTCQNVFSSVHCRGEGADDLNGGGSKFRTRYTYGDTISEVPKDGGGHPPAYVISYRTYCTDALLQ